MKEGTIVLDSDGSVFKVIQKNFPSKGITWVQYVDEDEPRYLEITLSGFSKMYEDANSHLQFSIAHGIHKRLNRLSKV